MGGGVAESEADYELLKEENLISTSKVSAAADAIVDITVQSPPANQTCSIGPVTPDADREIGGVEQHHHLLSSPLTDTTETNDDSDSSSSHTPKETLFDSFAPPGTDDKLMLAPHHNKYNKFIREQESRVNVVRRLIFKDVATTNLQEEEEEEEEEEHMFQIVYGAVVDAIVSEQQQRLGDESPRTPPKSLLIGPVETPCPGAPIKSTTKYSRVNLLDKEICKRLEF